MTDEQEQTKEKICDTLMGKKRYLNLRDLFSIKCKKCGSEDVDLYANDCGECGSYIDAECNNCKSEYRYHEFKQIIG